MQAERCWCPRGATGQPPVDLEADEPEIAETLLHERHVLVLIIRMVELATFLLRIKDRRSNHGSSFPEK
jgi:hypothetical protein